MPTEDATPRNEEDERPLGATIERLVGAGKVWAQAEVDLAKRRGALLAGAAKWIAILGLLAAITAFGMIVTLMIGAVLALAPLWGLGWAVLAVTGIALIVVLLCALGIKVQIGRIGGIVK